MLNYDDMDAVLPNLTSLEDRIKDAVNELQHLRATSGGSSGSGGISSEEKKAIRKQIQKIIDLIEKTESVD